MCDVPCGPGERRTRHKGRGVRPVATRGARQEGVTLQRRGWSVGSLALLIVLLAGCRSADDRVAAVGASAPGDELIELASSGAPNRVGVPISGGAAAASARHRADGQEGEQGQEGDEAAEKDYWAAVSFDRTNFEEVRDFVRQRYIDPDVDHSRGYAEAAAFAMASDDERVLFLMPEAFLEARKDHPDEKGRLKGKATKLRPEDPFVFVEEVEAQQEDDKRVLSDDEIRDLRARDRERSRLLDATWKQTGFSAADFQRVMGAAPKLLGKSPDWSVKKAWIAAAQGYLYSLDPHSSLIAKMAWEDSTKEVTDSSFEGIGAILTRRPDSEYTMVESPIEGQPAVKAGVRAGDVIVKVDGKEIKGWLLPKVVSKIRGKKGTRVVLTLQREGHPEPIDIPIIREHIDIKNVSGHLVNGHDDIAYIKVTGFVPTTGAELARRFSELGKEARGGKLRGLILDLRHNSGGLLKEAIKMADRFLDGGVIVKVRDRDGEEEVHRARSGQTWDLPLAVLVNSGSASASEILASAIQDNGRGLVVGDRTFGKASVQTLFSPLLRDDYYIKLTVARFYAPSGRTLQVLGVAPDVVLPPEIDGKMPLGFREENLSHHLPPLSEDSPSANAAWTRVLEACADGTGKARQIWGEDPNPAIKFDYQLMRAADIVECMTTHPHPATAAAQE